MKLFKNALLILALFTIGSISAKRMGGSARPGGSVTPPPSLPSEGTTAPAIPKKQFSFLLDDIRNMNQKNVISEDGEFTDSFTSMVQSSGLAPEFMIELLMAGRNLHLPLSGNDEVDMAVIKYNDEVIKEFMANLEPAGSIPYAGSVQQPVPDFYNENNDLLNLTWLESQIKSLVQNNATEDTFAEFKKNTIKKMTEQWQQRGTKNVESLKTRVSNQINQMTIRVKSYAEQQQASRPTITSQQVLQVISKIKGNTQVLKDWLMNDPADYKFSIEALVDMLRQQYPEQAKTAPRHEIAKNILQALISYNNNKSGNRTESVNINLIQGILAENEFGQLALFTKP